MARRCSLLVWGYNGKWDDSLLNCKVEINVDRSFSTPFGKLDQHSCQGWIQHSFNYIYLVGLDDSAQKVVASSAADAVMIAATQPRT